MRERSCRRATAVLGRAASGCEFSELLDAIRNRGLICVHFHPDRLVADGRGRHRTVASAMAAQGRYRNQFETGISNGGLTARPGGERDRWEERLFGGAYQRPGTTAAERPKYGALDLMRHPDGPAPRFGSCHLRLRPQVLSRCTLGVGDSVTEPDDVGTWQELDPVLAGLLEAVESGQRNLGVDRLTVPALIECLRSAPSAEHVVGAVVGRALDDYIEAHVHGDLLLDRDVELLVADPSFRGTSVEVDLQKIAAQSSAPLVWHPGFELRFDAVPASFRGPAMPVLARRLQREFAPAGANLDAAVIGRAAATVNQDPARWEDWGTPVETLQHLKQLWHVLVRYG